MNGTTLHGTKFSPGLPLSLLLLSLAAHAQSPSPQHAPALTQEFPVIMQQKLEAGKTPVGTKVQAKLVVASLVNGIVFPRNSLFTGEVTDSIARKGDEPSRLAIRMHTLQSGDKTIALEADLTGWIYPVEVTRPQDLSFQPPDEQNSPKNWNGGGAYPDPNNPVSQQKFPGRDSDRDSGQQAGSPSSAISKHRVTMKGVVEFRDADDRLTLRATKFNIKIDRLTTYVLTPTVAPAQN